MTFKLQNLEQQLMAISIQRDSLCEDYKCAREDSNFHILKRILAPQASASTNSATCAFQRVNIQKFYM